MSLIRNAIKRARNGEDIGLDQGGQRGRQRTINRDGTYNMERITGRLFGNFYLYHWLITTSWKNFWFFAFAYYGIMNLLFAIIFYAIGSQYLEGMPVHDPFGEFLYCFFFSSQSFSTVGYGGIHPVGTLTNIVATIEAFVGVMTFAVSTGTLYGRFSRPVSNIKYSEKIIIAPFNDITGMQFMVANQLASTLMEMEAKVNISWVEDEGDGKTIRRFSPAKLEFEKIAMFPTSWVINHPIDEESPLYGKTAEELIKIDLEVFVLLKGFDDVFSQTIYSRQSYKADQFVFGAKFRRPFDINEEGKLTMDLTKVGDYDQVNIPNHVSG